MNPVIPVRPGTVWGPALGSPAPERIGEHHDVLVIGAGITGLSTALLLARQGFEVAVVDARRPGEAGTTARSSAKATLLQGTLGSRIRAEHGAQALDEYVAANCAGQDLIREIVDDTGLVDMQVRDCWTYATTAGGAAQVRDEYDALRLAGLPVRLDPPLELPFPTSEAVCLPDQIQINPAQYLTALHAELTRLGVDVVWPFRVGVVDRRGDRLHATSTQGFTTSARWIVMATLMPFPVRTLAFANSTAMRSYLMAARIDFPVPRGMYLNADAPRQSLRTALTASGEEVLLVGGYGHPVGEGHPTSTHVADLAGWVHSQFGVREFTHRWSAQDYSTSHMLPQVGPSPAGPEGLLIATGFGKWGITNGSAAALALAGHIRGTPPHWSDVYAPRAAAWSRILRQNARVAYTLAKGWIVEPHQGNGIRAGLPVPRAVSHVDGRRRDCSAVCTHLGGIVRWNDAERSWDCPLHGSRFASDGAVLDGPAVSDLEGHTKQGVSSLEAPDAM